MMTKFKVSIIINRSPDVVNEALLKPSNLPYWEAYLQRFVMVKGEPGEKGSVALLFFSRKGNSYMMEEELICSEPGKRYVSQLTGTTLSAIVETVLVPAGDGTEMTLNWSGRGKTFLLKLLIPLMKRKLMSHTEKELETFKGLVETRGSDFSIL